MDHAAVKYTVTDLDAMTPAARARALEECLADDLNQVPEAYQSRIEMMHQRRLASLARQQQRSAS